jgi:hypothetical protein
MAKSGSGNGVNSPCVGDAVCLVVSVGNDVEVTVLVEAVVGVLVLVRVRVGETVTVASISGVVMDEHPVNINSITNSIQVIL